MGKTTDIKQKLIADMANIYFDIVTLRSRIIFVGETNKWNTQYSENHITESMEHFAHALAGVIIKMTKE